MKRLRGAVALLAGVALLVALALLTGAAPPARADTPPQYGDGAATFRANCAVCHGPTGGGVPGLAPPLTHYPALYGTLPEGRRQLALMVLFGMFGDVTVDGHKYNFKMPDFARLNDETLAGVLNYVVFDLGATAPLPPDAQRSAIVPAEVAALREPRLTGEQVRAHREALLPQVGL